MTEEDALRLEIHEAVVEALLSASMPRTMRDLEGAAQKAVDRGGGGVAPTRLRQLTKEVVVRMEDDGHVRRNTGGTATFELTPSGRAKLMF